ncbi:MAG: rhomboid family intramembrane serine protease [Micromonosporaceae bacterium]|nr:rhomboid family intramembrane serine protease [Micromonosporaceae bacterium]
MKDNNPTRRTGWVTYALIAANVIIFLLTPATRTLTGTSLTALCHQQAFFDQWAAIPHELITNQQLPRVPTGVARGGGCLLGPPGFHKIPALSVLYAMFLHGGWLHLLGNMLFLWVFGNNVEDRFGHLKYLLFYLVAGYAAGYGYALANADSMVPLIGASGAIAGVLGAYLVLYPGARVWSLVPVLLFIPLRLPAWLVLGLWFVLQWVYASGIAVSGAGSVGYLAHVVGFVVGVLVALPVRWFRRPPARQTTYYGWR